MFDIRIRRHIDPISDVIGAALGKRGVTANTVTTIGFIFGLMAFAALIMGHVLTGLVFIIFNRIADGLDGAVARYHGVTVLGGYLDIVTDFIFYELVPLGFALHDPGKAQAAAFLVVSFIGTGSSFWPLPLLRPKEVLKALFAGANRSIILEG